MPMFEVVARLPSNPMLFYEEADDQEEAFAKVREKLAEGATLSAAEYRISDEWELRRGGVEEDRVA